MVNTLRKHEVNWLGRTISVSGVKPNQEKAKQLIRNSRSKKARKEIKGKITSTPILRYADYNIPIYLRSDAYKNNFAAIVIHDRKGRHVLIKAIFGTTLVTEKNYGSVKIECVYVIWAAKEERH